MKKLKLFVLIAGILVSIISLCSFRKNNITTVKGIIRVYGNEPFTFIGIKTENEKEYTVIAEPETEKELRKTQGNTIEITGIITRRQKEIFEPEILKDGKIEVKDWKCLK